MARKKSKITKSVNNPFKFIAEGLAVSGRDDVWEEKPVSIQEFIEGESYCDQKYDPETMTGCRPEIMKIAKKLVDENVRESILLLGKGCINGDSEILLADGSYHKIKDLWNEYGGKKTVEVYHRDEEGKPISSKAAIKYSGNKLTYKVVLSNGNIIHATKNHGFFQNMQRIELKDLKVGDVIDTVKNTEHVVGDELLTQEQARFLGYMTGDGHTNFKSQNKSDFGELREKFCFTTGDRFIKEDFIKCLKSMDPGCEPTVSYHYDSGVIQEYGDHPPKNHKWMIWFSSGYGKCTSGSGKSVKLPNKPLHAYNACRLLMSTSELYGKCSATKQIPKIIFKCTNNLIGHFLSGYWMTDGEVNWKKKRNSQGEQYLDRVYCNISSKSKELMSGVQKLLLRLNIRANVKTTTKFVKAINKKYTGHSCGFIRSLFIHYFHKNVPLISYKKYNLDQFVKRNFNKKYSSPENKVTIISIEKHIKEPVYDITIKCGTRKIRNYIVDCWYSSNSGKDYISSLVLLYMIYRCLCMRSPQKYHRLAPGSSLYFVNVARNESQAKNVFFKEFVGHLENCRWFDGKYEEPGTQRIDFDKKITALSGNSQAFGWLGYNTIAWVGDELAFFLSKDGTDEDEDNLSKAEECWLAAYGSCQTRFPDHYKMIGITTPRFDDDFVMKKFYELRERMKNVGDAYVRQAATWDIHPRLTIEDFKHEFQRDRRRTMRDFGAEPMGVMETFWGDPEYLQNNVCSECKQCPVYKNCFDSSGNVIATDPYMCWDYEDCKADVYMGNGKFREWFVPDSDASYTMHFDLSKNKDRTGFSLTHVVDYIKVELDMTEKMKLQQERKNSKDKDIDFELEDFEEERALMQVDFVGWVNPKSKRDPDLTKNGEVYYDGILNHIIMKLLQLKVNLVKVTFDQYQSHYLKQKLEDLGIEVELLSLDRTDEVPVEAKNAIIDNRVIYPWNYILCREARHLKYVNGKKVDHPSGYGKDIIDGFFGSIYNADNIEDTGGSFFGVEQASWYDD